MRPAFASQLKFPSLLRIEKDNGFNTQAAILGPAKAKDINTQFLRHFGRGAAQCNKRIGKTGTIHMHRKVKFLGHFGQGF